MNIQKKEEKKSIDLKINDIVPEQVQKNIGKMIKDCQPMIQAQANAKAMVELFNTSVKISIPDTKQIQETINNFKRVFATFTNFEFSELSDISRRITAGIPDVVQKIKIPSISEEKKQQIIESYRIWGSYGWTVNPYSNAKTLFKIMPVDRKSADAIALKQCSKKNMEQVFEIIEKTKRVKKTDFSEAIFDYEHKKYKSCALILLSLIDAALIRLQKKSSLNGKRRNVGIKAVHAAKKRTEADVNTTLFLTAIFCCNLFACLEKVFENGNDFKKQPAIINRNFLDHGMLTKKVARKDCVQLFLLYYNVLELLDMIY